MANVKIINYIEETDPDVIRIANRLAELEHITPTAAIRRIILEFGEKRIEDLATK